MTLQQKLEDAMDGVYESLEGDEDLANYHDEHGTTSLLILTQTSQEEAEKTAKHLAPHIDGKNVIEIGAGIGLLAVEMAKRAKSVVAIEVDPAWSWVFTKFLYQHKPKNLTWVFGTAESVAHNFKADVAVCCTRSGQDQMRAVAEKMADKVIFPLQGLS